MNKPVAWMMKAREPSLHSPDYITFETPTRDMKVSHHPYPLYTHPVKEQEPDLYSEDGFPLWTSPQFKELTDEEIESVLTPFVMAQFQLNKPSPQFDYLGFAKAILRKAQEK